MSRRNSSSGFSWIWFIIIMMLGNWYFSDDEKEVDIVDQDQTPAITESVSQTDQDNKIGNIEVDPEIKESFQKTAEQIKKTFDVVVDEMKKTVDEVKEDAQKNKEKIDTQQEVVEKQPKDEEKKIEEMEEEILFKQL